MLRLWSYALTVLLALHCGYPIAVSDAQIPTPLDSAQAWLLAQQQEDGGWSDTLSENSGPGITADTTLALWAAGVDLQSLAPSPLDYLANYASRNANELRPLLAAKFSIVATLAERNITTFGGVNLIDIMASAQVDGLWGGDVYSHVWLLVAMQLAGQPVDATAIETLLALQEEDGSWGFTEGEASDLNATALVYQFLLTQDQTNLPAFRWLVRQTEAIIASNNATGYDSYSIASLMMALNGSDLLPQDDLEALQTTLLQFQLESGAFAYRMDSPPDYAILSTPQAILALAGYTLASTSPP